MYKTETLLRAEKKKKNTTFWEHWCFLPLNCHTYYVFYMYSTRIGRGSCSLFLIRRAFPHFILLFHCVIDLLLFLHYCFASHSVTKWAGTFSYPEFTVLWLILPLDLIHSSSVLEALKIKPASLLINVTLSSAEGSNENQTQNLHS